MSCSSSASTVAIPVRGLDRAPKEIPDMPDPDSTCGDAPSDGEPTQEHEIGAGASEVYALYLPKNQATSNDRWPIKIGREGPDDLHRRLSLFLENAAPQPRYLL